MADRIISGDALGGSLVSNSGQHDMTRAIGQFNAVCRDADGTEIWRDSFPNLVTTAGKNLLLETTLSGASYTVVGPYMGLISSTSFSTIVIGDTMGGHGGWLEAGSTNNPFYTARIICAWSSASAGAKALSAGLTFTFTSNGTVQGAFIVTGTGAVVTNQSTAGTLYSAGVLGTPQPVISTNTLTLSYSTTLT